MRMCIPDVAQLSKDKCALPSMPTEIDRVATVSLMLELDTGGSRIEEKATMGKVLVVKLRNGLRQG